MIPFSAPVTIYRVQGPPQYEKGVLIKDANRAAIVVAGSIQPMSTKDIRLLPEGRANVGQMVFYTEAILKVPQDAKDDQSDRVLFDKWLWEPVEEQNWIPFMPHHRYLLERREPYP